MGHDTCKSMGIACGERHNSWLTINYSTVNNMAQPGGTVGTNAISY